MMDYTPGPWKVYSSREYQGTYAVENCNAWHDEPEGIANAKLIAAAPDMLEALEAWQEAMGWIENQAQHEANEKMIAAIVKAKVL